MHPNFDYIKMNMQYYFSLHFVLDLYR